MNIELSIIITSYKNSSVLRLCLESLKKNILEPSYEILVVDSATEEDTEMMMREEFPEVRFLPSKTNLGFARLVNLGLKRARGKYLLILNADIIVGKKSIDLMLDFAKKHPDIGMIGPKLLNFDGKLQYSCFRFYTPSTILYRRTFLGKMRFTKRKIDRFLYKDKDTSKPQEVDWVMGSAILTSKKAVEKVGPMEENFGFMYFEDVDWCRRFWENNLKVLYYPIAEMYHYHGKGSASQNAFRALLCNRLTREHVKSAFRYFWKHAGKKNPHNE